MFVVSFLQSKKPNKNLGKRNPQKHSAVPTVQEDVRRSRRGGSRVVRGRCVGILLVGSAKRGRKRKGCTGGIDQQKKDVDARNGSYTSRKKSGKQDGFESLKCLWRKTSVRHRNVKWHGHLINSGSSGGKHRLLSFFILCFFILFFSLLTFLFKAGPTRRKKYVTNHKYSLSSVKYGEQCSSMNPVERGCVAPYRGSEAAQGLFFCWTPSTCIAQNKFYMFYGL